jgi:hypothetical protein
MTINEPDVYGIVYKPHDLRPHPEIVDERLTNLERESQEHTEEIVNADWNLKALLMRVEALERKAQDDGK